jgi:pyruvate dehydrogenase E1 component alpha subunit
MSDPQKYRTKEEVEMFKGKDSIDRFTSYLLTERKGPDGRPVLSEPAFMDMQAEVREAVKQSIDFAENSPAPDVEAELYSDVYVNPQKNLSPSRDYHHGAKNPLL